MSNLVLTRYPGEMIDMTASEPLRAGEVITLTLLAIVGSKVRFSIQAPKSVLIDRREVTERKKKELERLT